MVEAHAALGQFGVPAAALSKACKLRCATKWRISCVQFRWEREAKDRRWDASVKIRKCWGREMVKKGGRGVGWGARERRLRGRLDGEGEGEGER